MWGGLKAETKGDPSTSVQWWSSSAARPDPILFSSFDAPTNLRLRAVLTVGRLIIAWKSVAVRTIRSRSDGQNKAASQFFIWPPSFCKINPQSKFLQLNPNRYTSLAQFLPIFTTKCHRDDSPICQMVLQQKETPCIQKKYMVTTKMLQFYIKK
jgi:hypothetical protein